MEQLIKQDINLLEYPLYVLTQKNIKENLNVSIEGKEYSLLVGYKTPNSLDILYLYYFIKILQENNYSKEIIIKQSELIKEVSKGCSTFYYSRLKESLKIWKNIGLSFKGNFYDGKKYQVMEFGVIDYGKVEENGEITICFNDIFLSILKNTNFYRYINFSEFKKLRKPASRRLYELLLKSSFPYKIDIMKLASKMPLKQLYPSQIIRELKPAVKEINQATDLKIDFYCRKNSSGNTICIFEDKRENKNTSLISNQLETNINSEIQSENIKHNDLFELLPESGKTEINFELIRSFLAKGFDYKYIESNIKYSKINAKQNFSFYFAKSLKSDYAKSFRQEHEIKGNLDKKRKEIENDRIQKDKETLKLNEDAHAFLSSLDEDTYTKYKAIAVQVLIEEWKNRGFNEIATEKKLPAVCIKQKIYLLFGQPE